MTRAHPASYETMRKRLSPTQRTLFDAMQHGDDIEESPHWARNVFTSGLHWTYKARRHAARQGRQLPRIRRNTLESLVDRGLVVRIVRDKDVNLGYGAAVYIVASIWRRRRGGTA